MIVLAGVLAAAALWLVMGHSLGFVGPIGFAIGVAAGLALLAVYLANEFSQAKRRRVDAVRDEFRYVEVARAVAGGGVQTFNVTGPSAIWPILFLLALGAGLFALALHERQAAIAAGAGLFCVVVVLGLPGAIASIGKPVLTLDRLGFRSRWIPMFSWHEVTSIRLVSFRYRYDIVTHSLLFRIPSLARKRSRLPPLIRAMFALRFYREPDVLPIPLRNTNEAPRVVYRMAMKFWSDATGRDAGGADEIDAVVAHLKEASDGVVEAAQAAGLPAKDLEALKRKFAPALGDRRRRSGLGRGFQLLLAIVLSAVVVMGIPILLIVLHGR